MNNDRAVTLKALEDFARISPAHKIMVDIAYASTHEERTDCVRRAVDDIVVDMCKYKNLQQDRSEDELSIWLVLSLKRMGLLASHDTQYGGHCDIVVEHDHNFLWIAESKKHSTYDWLLKGFRQLLTRYSTGLYGQDQGDIIIFVYNKNAMDVLSSWRTHLIDNYPDGAVEDIDTNFMRFYSYHVHPGTGRRMTVRHFVVPLYFDPQDK